MPFHIDSVLLKSFIAVAESGTISHAAENVGRTQAAVSQQIKKLEDSVGCMLFERGSRHIKLTEQGEIFLNYAKQIIQLQWELHSRLKEPEIEGEIKIGIPEDFATHYLPNILASFRKHHPRVQLNVSCDLTLNLIEGYRKGEYDVILVKRDPKTAKGGTRVWREPLVWVAADYHKLEKPLSLVLSPQPCVYRTRALTALNNAKMPWHLSYTSPSLAGTIAAVKAGLGITVLPANMIPEGVHIIHDEIKLPKLSDAEIALIKREDLSKAAEMFVNHIIHSIEVLK